MECRHGNFWIGLGIGSILGAVAYRLSRTAKARQLESDIYNAIHRIGRDAEIAAWCNPVTVSACLLLSENR